jgi:hypothetical protein
MGILRTTPVKISPTTSQKAMNWCQEHKGILWVL